jgi:hypothetical protein
MPNSSTSTRLILFCFGFGLAACALAAPPGSTPKPQKEQSVAPLYSETQAALYEVPEVRLFTDEQVQDDLDSKYLGKYKLPTTEERTAFLYRHNLNVHRSMIAAGLREGLPLQTKGAFLPVGDAAVMQLLSKELRTLGFVSAVKSDGTPAERVETFRSWCSGNHIEKFAGVSTTLVQMLQVEDAPVRLVLVEQLAKIKSTHAGALIAKRAIYDPSAEVRRAAVIALKKRREKEYLSTLLGGLRYPWPAVADRAALALAELKPKEGAAALCDLLEKPDPCVPFRDPKSKRLVVSELVRLNHLRNCYLCHAPSADENDGLVRGAVPPPPLLPTRKRQFTPGGVQTSEDGRLERIRKDEQETPENKRYYNAGAKREAVRADITLLHQDFSANLKVERAAQWPEVQRFDFVVRQRSATPEEIDKVTASRMDYPQRRAALRALRGITGQDGGDSAGRWRELIGVTTREK